MDLACRRSPCCAGSTTAAEWDTQARANRQQVLDNTLALVRKGQRIVVGVNLLLVATNLILVALVLWLLSRG